jgi:hypothetical protein
MIEKIVECGGMFGVKYLIVQNIYGRMREKKECTTIFL